MKERSGIQPLQRTRARIFDLHVGLVAEVLPSPPCLKSPPRAQRSVRRNAGRRPHLVQRLQPCDLIGTASLIGLPIFTFELLFLNSPLGARFRQCRSRASSPCGALLGSLGPSPQRKVSQRWF